MFYCYLIQSNNCPNFSYIGITNNLEQRLKQHNGEIKGGAKCTRRFTDWEYVLQVGLKDKRTASSLEWYWKHKKNSKNKWQHTRSGISNKIERLKEIIHLYQILFLK